MDVYYFSDAFKRTSWEIYFFSGDREVGPIFPSIAKLKTNRLKFREKERVGSFLTSGWYVEPKENDEEKTLLAFIVAFIFNLQVASTLLYI